MLVAALSIGAWETTAETNTFSAAAQLSPSIRVSPRTLAAVRKGAANPAIRVSARSLDFAPVGVGQRRTLTFTVQNAGAGILTGEAKVPAPFSVLGASRYVLGSTQSQTITVQYLPQATGMNLTVVVLTGGGGASITVSGSAFPARPAAPASPGNVRMWARSNMAQGAFAR